MGKQRFVPPVFFTAAFVFCYDLAMGAAERAEMLIVVADPRRVDWSVAKWWVDCYNTNPVMFGLWCTIFTALLGVSLALLSDTIMKLTGLDLKSRNLIEH